MHSGNSLEHWNLMMQFRRMRPRYTSEWNGVRLPISCPYVCKYCFWPESIQKSEIHFLFPAVRAKIGNERSCGSCKGWRNYKAGVELLRRRQADCALILLYVNRLRQKINRRTL